MDQQINPSYLVELKIKLVTKTALEQYKESCGSNRRKQYLQLTSKFFDNSSLIDIVYGSFHNYINEKKGYVVPLDELKFEDWDAFTQHVLHTYDVDLASLNKDSLRTDHFKLYKNELLHEFASQGIIRHTHVRAWGKTKTVAKLTASLAGSGVQPTSTEDLNHLFTLAKNIDDTVGWETYSQIAEMYTSMKGTITSTDDVIYLLQVAIDLQSQTPDYAMDMNPQEDADGMDLEETEV